MTLDPSCRLPLKKKAMVRSAASTPRRKTGAAHGPHRSYAALCGCHVGAAPRAESPRENVKGSHVGRGPGLPPPRDPKAGAAPAIAPGRPPPPTSQLAYIIDAQGYSALSFYETMACRNNYGVAIDMCCLFVGWFGMKEI
ncbi:hypothetical protein [Oryza sativa Japonica Group]|uniref:Uncharacterized protein n=1 Tax=Oryza sativa subsp. japonica TaxID=39947 RepID=Q5JLP5_ORYSJ|nr:hypothetical protein [Oryza sativa Japonica Group]